MGSPFVPYSQDPAELRKVARYVVESVEEATLVFSPFYRLSVGDRCWTLTAASQKITSRTDRNLAATIVSPFMVMSQLSIWVYVHELAVEKLAAIRAAHKWQRLYGADVNPHRVSMGLVSALASAANSLGDRRHLEELVKVVQVSRSACLACAAILDSSAPNARRRI